MSLGAADHVYGPSGTFPRLGFAESSDPGGSERAAALFSPGSGSLPGLSFAVDGKL